MKEIAKHLDYDDFKSLNLTCKGIRSRLMQDFRELSRLVFSFDGGLDEPRKIKQFNRHLSKCLTSRAIPFHITLDFSSSYTYDLSKVLWRFFQKFGKDVKTFKLRLRDVQDVEQLLGLWEFMTSLTELELEYGFDWTELVPKNLSYDYAKGLYLSSLQKLSLPFDTFDLRPVKAFLFQVDMTNLTHLSSPDGEMLTEYNMRILKRYTGYQFELEEACGTVRYKKTGEPDEVLLDTSSEEEDSEFSVDEFDDDAEWTDVSDEEDEAD